MGTKYSPGKKLLSIALGISAIIFITCLWQFSQDQRFTLFFINKALASTAVFLLSLSYLMGPLVKLFPPLRPFLLIRKYFGIFGFFAVGIHIITSALQLNSRIPIQWYIDHLLGIVAGVIASIIFLCLYFTSNDNSYLKLGPKRWKQIQRLGYIALFLSLIHIWFASSTRWILFLKGEVAMPLSLKAFCVVCVVILLRIVWIGVDKLFPKSTS